MSLKSKGMLQNKAKEEIIDMYVSLEQERTRLKRKERRALELVDSLAKIAGNIFTLIFNIRVAYKLIRELIKLFRG